MGGGVHLPTHSLQLQADPAEILDPADADIPAGAAGALDALHDCPGPLAQPIPSNRHCQRDDPDPEAFDRRGSGRPPCFLRADRRVIRTRALGAVPLNCATSCPQKTGRNQHEGKWSHLAGQPVHRYTSHPKISAAGGCVCSVQQLAAPRQIGAPYESASHRRVAADIVRHGPYACDASESLPHPGAV
jgi:hypothetical protein